jgi:glycosyltransferase involved in cell wall biosynthesis
MSAPDQPQLRVEPCLGVIVPAFNEERTIGRVLERVLRQPSVAQVVIVDDASTDRTAEAIRPFAGDPRVALIRHERNQGKGVAIRTALGSIEAPIVVIQDADMEYDPGEYDTLIAPILAGRTDVVYGVRGFLSHTSYSYWFVIGNRLVTTATNVLFNCYIQDMETGFKAMRTDLMKRLHLSGKRFDIEPEITGRLLRLGYRIHEVPISYYARGREEGKKLTWRDGIRALGTLTRIRLASQHQLFADAGDYHRERQAELAVRRLPPLPDERPVNVVSGTRTEVQRGVSDP